jgi:hypothetical protein
VLSFFVPYEIETRNGSDSLSVQPVEKWRSARPKIAPRTGTVVESRHDAELFGPPQACLDRLMRHAEGSTHRVKGRRLAIRGLHPCPLDPARQFCPRTRKPRQLRHILPRKRQFDHATWSCHDPIRLVQQITEQAYKHRVASTESPAYERVQGIDLIAYRVPPLFKGNDFSQTDLNDSFR